jgi:predicted nucleic acid-binding protein
LAGETEAKRLVVCDAGPLIHLDELGCLDLLADLGRVVSPEAVWQEVNAHRPQALASKVLSLDRLEVQRPLGARLLALVQAFSLDAGEREALSLLEEFQASVFLTDDAAARLASMKLGFEVHGTVGVLIRAVRRRLRTPNEVALLLSAIPRRSTLYIQPRLLEEVIDRVRTWRPREG